MEPVFETEMEITGPWRTPVNMLSEQSYDGHASLHDDDTAAKLGLRQGAIEAPTHFSQFEPMAIALWGQRWYETGCISAHFQSICAEGDQARAHVHVDRPDPAQVRLRLERGDGQQILVGTASIGPAHPASELDARVTRMERPAELFIIDQLNVGQRSAAAEHVVMDFDQHMGNLYPFTLRQKLATITEQVSWHDPSMGERSPWGRPVIPFEMVSVLTQYTSKGPESGYVVRGPAVGLFLDLEVRLLNGPLFVGETYVLRREIVAISASKRTESFWTRTTITNQTTNVEVAHVVLHQGVFKESYAEYPKDRLR